MARMSFLLKSMSVIIFQNNGDGSEGKRNLVGKGNGGLKFFFEIELAQLIVFERECCPFLRFNLSVEATNGPLWLELTGPDGTKAFLQSLFSA